jgi:hypothetical protein
MLMAMILHVTLLNVLLPRLTYFVLKRGQNQRFRVLFDSGCSATMINKRFVKHWKKTPVKAIKWSTKAGVLKPKEVVR